MNNGKKQGRKDGCLKLLKNDLSRWKTAHLERITRNLRYEGKNSRGKNMKEMAEFLSWLDKAMSEHIKMEEKVVFPFVKRHFPRLDLMADLFCGQHEELWGKFKKLKLFFRRLQKQKANPKVFVKTAGKIHTAGIYTACYLRHHLFTENEKILRVLGHELRKDEKRELSEQMNRYSERTGHHNGFGRG